MSNNTLGYISIYIYNIAKENICWDRIHRVKFVSRNESRLLLGRARSMARMKRKKDTNDATSNDWQWEKASMLNQYGKKVLPDDTEHAETKGQ